MPEAIDFTGLPDRLREAAIRETETLLTDTLIDGMSFLNYMGLIPEVTDRVDLTQMFISDVLQPGGKDDFTPMGKLSFKNRMGQVRDCKVDYTLTPKEINALWKSYLGKIYKSKRGDVYDVPFMDFVLKKMTSKVQEQLQLQGVFQGVFREDVRKGNRVFDGLLPLLSDSGIVPNANIFAGAPITQTNAIDQLEGIADKVPSQLVNTDLIAIVEPEVLKFYNRDYRGTFGTIGTYTEFKQPVLDGTNITLVAEPGLAGTGAVLMTERENFQWLTGPLNNRDAFIIEKSKRNINIMLDFQAAPDLSIAERVWCNDLALLKGVALRNAAAAEPASE